MEQRRQINDRLTEWIEQKVKTEYPGQIALVLLYGSWLNGTANARSDIDCYFIPKHDRGYRFAQTFRIAGVGYDIFPMDWDRVARIADLRESLTPLVGDVKILWYDTEEDVLRFRAMQARLQRNLQNTAYLRAVIGERCQRACNLRARLDRANSLTQARVLSGQILMTLAEALVLRSHDYFHFGLKRQFADLQARCPAHIAAGYEAVVKAPDIPAVRRAAEAFCRQALSLLDISCTPERSCEPEPALPAPPDIPGLEGLYQEISSTFQKIYVCCKTGNFILAFLSAVCLQGDLEEAARMGAPRYALLEDFDHENLAPLSQAARDIEQDLVDFITRHGGSLRQYDSFEEFLACHP